MSDRLPKRVQGLGEIIGRYDGLLVDLWGCVHNGVEAYPAAVDALERAIAAGVGVCLLSNGPRRIAPIVARLDEMGVPRDAYQHAVTSGEATWQALMHPADDFHRSLGKRCHHLGPPRDVSTYLEADCVAAESLDDADFVLVTGPRRNEDRIEDYDVELAAALALDLPMVCANPDLLVHIGDDLVICSGLIAERYRDMGGKTSFHGKPFASVYDMAFEKLGGPDKRRVLGIGDAIRTDVAGAKAYGADALFLAAGIYRDDFGTDDPAPIAVLAKSDEEGHPAPEYFMPKLAW